MADIKLLVLCVAMVVVCLELEQGQAQGDVMKSYMTSHWLSTHNLLFWGKPASYFMPNTITKWKPGLASKLTHQNL